MVQIPTTERKYYNVTPKVNTLEAYASALQPALNQLQNTFREQQSIKIDSLSTDAKIRMNEATEQWRLANQSNPNNPEALKDIETQYNNILNEYRNQIDPIYRKNWDLTANKLRGAYSLQNQTWGIEQNKKNVTFDIQNAIKNNFSMAQSYGMNGQFTEALADYSASYEKLLDYGAKNLGTETAAQLLIDYESNYASQFLSGMAKNNPQGALDLLQDEGFVNMLGKDTGEMASKIIKNEMQRQDFEFKSGQYKNQLDLTNQIDDMNPVDALQTLEENRYDVSEKWYNLRKKSLLNQMGINAETQAEYANEILFDISSIPNEKPKDFVVGSSKVLDKIEDYYSSGKLSLSDKKIFVKELNKRQIKALPDYIKSESAWFKPYDFSDAKEDFDNSFSDSGMSNRAMLEYARTISDKDYDAKQRKELARSIISTYKNDALNNAIKNNLRIGDVIDGFRYKGGNKNNPNSWEKI